MSGRLHAVILAGGSGTRLWPWSRRARPKQLLPLVGDQSLLRRTVARLEGLVPAERIWILTNAEYVADIRAELPDLPPDQVIGEPVALGNAAAVALGTALVAARDPDATMAVLTADHLITPVAEFQHALRRAVEAAAAGYLVTFGVAPTYPATGFGYVEMGAPLTEVGTEEPRPRMVERFVEKPDAETAKQYVESGRFAWNSGMFVWRVATIRETYRTHLPGTYEVLESLRVAAEAGRLSDELDSSWSTIPDRTTVDYGILEPSDNVACVPARFEWADIGSWLALAEARADEANANGNLVINAGDGVAAEAYVGVDSSGCLIFTNQTRTVVTLGLTDMVVVDTGDVVLVMPKDRAQELGRAVNAVREAGLDDLT